MPGYGESAPADRLSYQVISQRMIEFFNTADVDRADVVALSFGGIQALHAVLDHPDRFGRLVLADTSPAFGMDGTRRPDWLKARLGPLDHGQTLADLAPKVLDAISGRPLDQAVRTDLIAAFVRIGEPGFRAAVECLPDNDVRDRLDEIVHSTLVLVGELDRETPVAYARVLADGLVNAVMTVLPGIGHLAPSEDPDLFNDHVRRFLALSGDRAAPTRPASEDP
jgi:3-oxoadipate enol-lactonase